jgi:tetratricopeptide (TPR) repeat protein
MSDKVASPKATGGAGTVFEYRVAAIMLAMLLRGAAPPIGTQLPFTRIGLQQRVTGHTLDDIVAFTGAAPRGTRIQMQVKLTIQVRGKDPVFAEVMAAAVKARRQHEQDIAKGAMLLGLVAGGTASHLDDLRKITEMARAQLDHEGIRALLSATNHRLCARYDHVLAAVAGGLPESQRENAEEVTRQVLASLHVWHVDAGPDGRDTRMALDWLSEIADNARASDIFSHLCDLAAEYGPMAAQIDTDMVRRVLRSRFGIHLRAEAHETGARLSIPRVCQLPTGTPHFQGRVGEVQELREVAEASAATDNESPRVAVIVGKPGVGKTALAIHVATELREEFHEAQLFVDLRGVDEQSAVPGEVLGQFLRALGLDEGVVPLQADERAALFRSVLADRRVLVVLDNAADAAQVQPLLLGPGPSLTIVTSRNAMAGLAGARQISLGVLSPGQAVEFLAASASRSELRDDPHIARVAELCGYLPLALRVAASTLAGWRAWSTAYLARSLQEERNRLDQLSPSDEIGVRASIGSSYRRLPSQTRKVFRLLSVIPVNQFRQDIAAIVTGLPGRAASRRLEELVTASLLDRAEQDGLFQFHDLIRLYAHERFEEEEPASEAAAAEHRLMKGILPSAVSAGRALTPAGMQSMTPEEAEAVRKGVHLRWLDETWPLIRAIFGLLAKHRLIGDLMLAIKDLERYVEMRDLWASWAEIAAFVTTATKGQAAPEPQILALTMLTNARTRSYDPDGAVTSANQLKAALTSVSSPVMRAEALNVCGSALRLAHRTDEALVCFEEAHRLYGVAKEPSGQNIVAHNIGSLHRDCGRYDAAIAYYEQDLAFWRQRGDLWEEAWTLNSIGGAYELAGMMDQAIDAHSSAYQIFYKLNATVSMSRCLHDLGLALAKSGRTESATHCHLADLALCRAHRDFRGIAMAHIAMGELAIDLDRERALEYVEQAIVISRQSGDTDVEATALTVKARLAVLSDDPDAEAILDVALRLSHNHESPRRYAQAMTFFGEIEQLPKEQRTRYLKEAIKIFDELGDHRDRDQATEILDDIEGNS